MCILCGCDYCGTIRGIGPMKSLDLIKKHKNIETVIKVGRFRYCGFRGLDKRKYFWVCYSVFNVVRVCLLHFLFVWNYCLLLCHFSIILHRICLCFAVFNPFEHLQCSSNRVVSSFSFPRTLTLRSTPCRTVSTTNKPESSSRSMKSQSPKILRLGAHILISYLSRHTNGFSLIVFHSPSPPSWPGSLPKKRSLLSSCAGKRDFQWNELHQEWTKSRWVRHLNNKKTVLLQLFFVFPRVRHFHFIILSIFRYNIFFSPPSGFPSQKDPEPHDRLLQSDRCDKGQGRPQSTPLFSIESCNLFPHHFFMTKDGG